MIGFRLKAISYHNKTNQFIALCDVLEYIDKWLQEIDKELM